MGVLPLVDNFIRFAEPIKLREEKRVERVTVRPFIKDCSGTIYFTDLQLQEGDKLSGYSPHTTTMLKKGGTPAKHFNGVIRSGNTVVIHTSGETSMGLDCYIYPVQAMAAGSIKLASGAGSHKAQFLAAANPGDEFALVASQRQCLRNGSPTPKAGFYQYTAVHDSKHQVTLEPGKSARVYIEFREMKEGEPRP